MDKINKKKAYLSYIYGYLNFIRVGNMNKPDSISWQEYKLNEVVKYCGLPQWIIVTFLSPFRYFRFLELIISILIVIFRYFYCILLKLLLKDEPLETNIIIIDEFPHENLLNKATIDKKDVTIITIPFTQKEKYEDVSYVNVLTKLKYRDIFLSLVWSIQLMFIVNKKYGHRDLFMRYYSSFEYLLAFIFSRKISEHFITLFYSTYSRWAYLNGGLLNKKIFIQHGILNGKWKLVHKTGKVDDAYYLSETQGKICERMLFTNNPICHYQTSIEFTITPTSDKKNILIIGNSNYISIEEDVLEKLSSNPSLLVFVKPHPNTKDKSFYHRMEFEHGITLLSKDDYPKVDYVISYNSTLATHYEESGVIVYRYSDENFENEIAELEHIKQKENA